MPATNSSWNRSAREVRWSPGKALLSTPFGALATQFHQPGVLGPATRLVRRFLATLPKQTLSEAISNVISKLHLSPAEALLAGHLFKGTGDMKEEPI